MAQIISQLNPASAEYKANAETMQTLVNTLQERVQEIALGGNQAARMPVGVAPHRLVGSFL